tara:strand:+ start:2210 stop:2467 length:258 start_codon:yes stop_codon:yes gene_type:complete
MRGQDNRNYVIVGSVDIGLIDFSEVMEDPNYLKYSLDGTRFIVKYDGSMPFSISYLPSASYEFTHSEILSEIATDFWQPDIDPVE